MINWKETRVGDIGKVITGKTPKTSIDDNYGGDIPFITPSDDMTTKYIFTTNKKLTEMGAQSVKNNIIPPNTICVSCIGSDLGKVVISTETSVTNQQINSIVLNENEYDLDFIYYVMTSLGKVMNHHSKTSTAVPIVNKTQFSDYTFMCPDLITQKKIGGVLASLDNKISNNRSINRNLEEQCFAIFHDLFDEEIKEEEYVQFCEYATFKYGTMPKKDKIVDEGYPIFSGYQIVGSYPEKMFDEPQLIIVARGVGGTGDVKYSPANCYLTNLAIAVMVNDRDYEDYLYHYLMCQDMKVLNTGSAQPQITISSLEKYKLYFPEKNKAKDFSRMIKPFIGEMRMMQQENERLNFIRDTLLPKLMSGELDVTDLDI